MRAFAQNGVTRFEEKTRWETFQEDFWAVFELEGSLGFELLQLGRNILYWVIENALWLGVLVLLLAALWFVHMAIEEKKLEIRRLWSFLLFFLSKRLMILPLLHDTGLENGWISQETAQKMVTLRQKARTQSLRTQPKARMQTEMEVSRLLVDIFTKIEQEKGLNHPIITNVGADLEFIDEKLVTLQQKYNEEAYAFNKKYAEGIKGKLFGLFGGGAIPLFND